MVGKNIKGNFEGYLWKSNEQKPKPFFGENLLKELTLNNEENPFYIEGQLYDRTTNQSVSIKYVDGEYLVNKYIVKKENNSYKFYKVEKNEKGEIVEKPILGEVVEKSYKGNKMKDLLFVELWQEEPDSNCCNMEVLRASKVAFVGFL